MIECDPAANAAVRERVFSAEQRRRIAQAERTLPPRCAVRLAARAGFAGAAFVYLVVVVVGALA